MAAKNSRVMRIRAETLELIKKDIDAFERKYGVRMTIDQMIRRQRLVKNNKKYRKVLEWEFI